MGRRRRRRRRRGRCGCGWGRVGVCVCLRFLLLALPQAGWDGGAWGGGRLVAKKETTDTERGEDKHPLCFQLPAFLLELCVEGAGVVLLLLLLGTGLRFVEGAHVHLVEAGVLAAVGVGVWVGGCEWVLFLFFFFFFFFFFFLSRLL
jgi:hypothetical protein